MRTCSGRVHARFMYALGDHVRKRGGLQRAERRLRGQEDLGVRDLRTCVAQVFQHTLSHRLGEREHNRLAALGGRNPEPILIPLVFCFCSASG